VAIPDARSPAEQSLLRRSMVTCHNTLHFGRPISTTPGKESSSMRRPFAISSAVFVLLALITALALHTPASLGQNLGPFQYVAAADAATKGAPAPTPAAFDSQILANAQRMIDEGRRIFRFDTFGSELFWGDQLRLHEALATVTPRAALGLGLKVERQPFQRPWWISCAPARLISMIRPSPPTC
jgi:hypothetical protein